MTWTATIRKPSLFCLRSRHVILVDGMTTDDMLLAYPRLTNDDILAAMSYSADVIEREELLVS